MDDFIPLSPLLVGYYHLPYEQLPPEIQERIRLDFFPLPWNGLSPEQRRRWAERWDYGNDPANEPERQRTEALTVAWVDTKRKVDKWKTIPTPTALDLQAQEQALASLEPKLAELDAARRKMRGDFPESADTQPPSNPCPSDASLGAQRRKELQAFAARNTERSVDRLAEWQRWGDEAARIQNRCARSLSDRQLAERIKVSLGLPDAVSTIRQRIRRVRKLVDMDMAENQRA